MSEMLESGTISRGRRIRSYVFLAAITGMVLVLDQLSKYLVRTDLSVGEMWSPTAWLAPYARIIHWNNTGAAFGLLPSAGTIFSIVAIVVTVAIIYYFPRVPENQVAIRIALALQLGGALGNLIDRVIVGTVTDFISLATFPVFNVADASITIGTALLLAAMWLDERRRKREQQNAGSGIDSARKDVGEA
jgi:signal peptidase II